MSAADATVEDNGRRVRATGDGPDDEPNLFGERNRRGGEKKTSALLGSFHRAATLHAKFATFIKMCVQYFGSDIRYMMISARH